MLEQRPSARDVAVVFALGVVGTLVPVIGWVLGIWLVLRASAWSRGEKAMAVLGPPIVILAVVTVVAAAFGPGIRPLPILAAVPLTTSLSSAVAAVYLAMRLVAHRQAVSRG